MKIANHSITASFTSKGAELTSLVKEHQEYLWQADAQYWGRHAPVLFPIVGKLKNEQFEAKGQWYTMGQHGFARDMEFEIGVHNSDSIEFILKSNSETQKIYPYKYSLTIRYELEDNVLKTTYLISNDGKDDMHFSIGAHPAFNCPLSAQDERRDYWLEFEHEENLETWLLDNGLFSGAKDWVDLSDGKLLLKDDLFDRDALVFKQLKSNYVSLCSAEKKWLTFHMKGFPYLGIWSKSRQSPFVCIEPWYGLADNTGHNQKLSDKEGILRLAPKEIFSCSYLVELH